MWCQADSTKLTHWSKEESGERPPLMPSSRADGPRTAAMDAVRVPSSGRNQIRRLMAVRHGHPPWPRRTAVVEEEVQNLEEKALHLFQHFLPLVACLSKSTIGFQGQRANFMCIGPWMLLWRMFLTLIPLIGESPTLWEMPSKISSLVPFSLASLELWLHWILGEGWS
jgi:hypothetical protein